MSQDRQSPFSSSTACWPVASPVNNRSRPWGIRQSALREEAHFSPGVCLTSYPQTSGSPPFLHSQFPYHRVSASLTWAQIPLSEPVGWRTSHLVALWAPLPYEMGQNLSALLGLWVNIKPDGSAVNELRACSGPRVHALLYVQELTCEQHGAVMVIGPALRACGPWSHAEPLRASKDPTLGFILSHCCLEILDTFSA